MNLQAERSVLGSGMDSTHSGSPGRRGSGSGGVRFAQPPANRLNPFRVGLAVSSRVTEAESTSIRFCIPIVTPTPGTPTPGTPMPWHSNAPTPMPWHSNAPMPGIPMLQCLLISTSLSADLAPSANLSATLAALPAILAVPKPWQAQASVTWAQQSATLRAHASQP